MKEFKFRTAYLDICSAKAVDFNVANSQTLYLQH